ncbi:MAG: hypothetical protein AL399_03200 [Candidatus [Bacteroides] periocalifornicus]|uniref:Uncharacterized protein n=1 Tax=Candidatus [Bacteroides] periocalifornicus TaxID=1702214 RepID=A0A0Q4B8E6_9BACT|nr:MAG: hypothetical protein AL399_03200 [Candidatus [Bacteroides] periocalifornicus]
MVGNPQIEGKSGIKIRKTLGEPMGEKIVVVRIQRGQEPAGGDGGAIINGKADHDASLRPPRNGRIGFKPPFSKRGTTTKGPDGFNLLGDFPFLRVNRFQSRNSISRRM